MKGKILSSYLFIILVACNPVEKNFQTNSNFNTNTLSSKNIEDSLQRINILKVEIKAFSELKDAEYELFNVNGFSKSETSLPGASGWDYRFVVKVAPKDVSKWATDMIEVTSIDFLEKWTNELVKHRIENWRVNSKPRFFMREGTDVVMEVFEEEGIIFKRVIQN